MRTLSKLKLLFTLSAITAACSSSPTADPAAQPQGPTATTSQAVSNSTWADTWGAAYVLPFASGGAPYRSVAAGPLGTAYTIGQNSQVYRYQNGTWTPMAQPALPYGGAMIEVASDVSGNVWATTIDGGYVKGSPAGVWTTEAGQNARAVSPGAGGDLWAIVQTCSGGSKTGGGTCTGVLNRYTGGTWTNTIASGYDVADLSVSPQGIPYIVTKGNYKVFRGTTAGGPWTDTGWNAHSIAAGSNGSVWIIGTDGQIYYFDPISNAWQWPTDPKGVSNTPGLVQISASPEGMLWGANSAGTIKRLVCGSDGQSVCQNGTADGWCDAASGSVDTAAGRICQNYGLPRTASPPLWTGAGSPSGVYNQIFTFSPPSPATAATYTTSLANYNNGWLLGTVVVTNSAGVQKQIVGIGSTFTAEGTDKITVAMGISPQANTHQTYTNVLTLSSPDGSRATSVPLSFTTLPDITYTSGTLTTNNGTPVNGTASLIVTADGNSTFSWSINNTSNVTFLEMGKTQVNLSCVVTNALGAVVFPMSTPSNYGLGAARNWSGAVSPGVAAAISPDQWQSLAAGKMACKLEGELTAQASAEWFASQFTQVVDDIVLESHAAIMVGQLLGCIGSGATCSALAGSAGETLYCLGAEGFNAHGLSQCVLSISTLAK